jgi:hypothetical protein
MIPAWPRCKECKTRKRSAHSTHCTVCNQKKKDLAQQYRDYVDRQRLAQPK